MVFTLIAHLWTQPGKEAEMKALLAEASQTYSKDQGTINWFVMQDTQDPTAWSIVERYDQESVSRSELSRVYAFNEYAALTDSHFI